MDYLNDIKKFISILVRSQKFHLLCISGAPGWAKTHTTRQFLGELGVTYQMLGAYSMPLALYNHLSDFSNDTKSDQRFFSKFQSQYFVLSWSVGNEC